MRLRISRRAAIAGAALLAAGAASGFEFARRSRALKKFGRLEPFLRRSPETALRDTFGAEFMASSAAAEFLAEYRARFGPGAPHPEDFVIQLAATSTTVVAHHKFGAPLEFRELALTLDAPCSNLLAAAHRPAEGGARSDPPGGRLT